MTYILIYFINYIIFLYLLKTIICSKKLNYNRCGKYLNDIYKYCSKYAIDENGFNSCIRLDNSFHIYNNIPKDCYKIINNDSNNSFDSNKQNNNNNNNYISVKDINLNDYKLDKDQIKQCLTFYKQFEQKCNYEKKNHNTETICNNWLRKQKISKFCYYAIFDIMNNFEIEAFNLVKNNDLNIEDLTMNDIIYYYLNNLRKENIDKIIEIMKEDEEAKNNNSLEETKFNDDEDDEADNSFIKYLKKDCVEYGLKSSKENIIVCTKYEE